MVVAARFVPCPLWAPTRQGSGTMPDDGFPSTQAIERARPIFFDEAGVPLEVFIDPGAVSNRPKLVRSLRVRFATFFFRRAHRIG